MKRLIILLGTIALICACGGGARKAEKEAEAARLDSIARVEAAADSAALAALQAEKEKNALSEASQLPEEPVFDIVTNMGTIKVRLYKGTPKHRDNFEKLALSGFYDSLLFHRVIYDFMIQGGDPYSRDTSLVAQWGEGGPGYEIPAEFVPEYRHKKGALAAARRGDMANPMKESSGSQFYIVHNPDNCAHLDGQYTVFGETIAGLNVIDKIASVPTNRRDLPIQEVRILSIRPDPEMNKKPE